MSGRSTVDIVTEYYKGSKLIGAGQALDKLIAIDALRPTCPTCGGTLTVRAATPSPETAGAARCPNCDDGKVSVARMAAVYKLLVDHMHPESPISEEIRSFCRYAVMECNVK